MRPWTISQTCEHWPGAGRAGWRGAGSLLGASFRFWTGLGSCSRWASPCSLDGVGMPTAHPLPTPPSTPLPRAPGATVLAWPGRTRASPCHQALSSAGDTRLRPGHLLAGRLQALGPWHQMCGCNWSCRPLLMGRRWAVGACPSGHSWTHSCQPGVRGLGWEDWPLAA